MASAISTGWPMRRSGISGNFRFEGRRDVAGLNRTGRNRVDSDAQRSHFYGDAAREGLHRRFAGAVGNLPGESPAPSRCSG